MSVKSYVLIETDVGMAKVVAEQLRGITHQSAAVLQVDTVTGPFDVIAQLDADDLNNMGTYITESIQTISGVNRTTTCLTLVLD